MAMSLARRGFLGRYYTSDTLDEADGWMDEATYNSCKPLYSPWPTYAEMKAIRSGYSKAQQEYPRHNWAEVDTWCTPGMWSNGNHLHGKNNYARVKLTESGNFCSINNKPHANGDVTTLKSWLFIPQWPARPTQQKAHDMKRIRGGQVIIDAPPAQGHVVYEDIHIMHQRRVNHHYGEDQHIEHGRPQNTHIAYDPSQVVVNQQAPQMHYHEPPKQTWFSAMLTGVRKPQQQAIPAPQQRQEVYKGQAQAIPHQGQQMALPSPIPAQRQPEMVAIAYQPAQQVQAPQARTFADAWRKK